jgi:short-subunit dehydrogenase
MVKKNYMQEKNIIITGASGGIGKDVAYILPKTDGMLSDDALSGTVRTARDKEHFLLCVGCNSTEVIAAAKKSILNDFRTIDVVINAG